MSQEGGERLRWLGLKLSLICRGERDIQSCNFGKSNNTAAFKYTISVKSLSFPLSLIRVKLKTQKYIFFTQCHIYAKKNNLNFTCRYMWMTLYLDSMDYEQDRSLFSPPNEEVGVILTVSYVIAFKCIKCIQCKFD